MQAKVTERSRIKESILRGDRSFPWVLYADCSDYNLPGDTLRIYTIFYKSDHFSLHSFLSKCIFLAAL